MYIKSIKTQGFKSFADKIELDFNKGISCIVGPNGSGKSNIVDALLWVMGEQSVKTLRGEGSMSDVIFTGSASRDGAKKASVAITFDNSDKLLNTEFNEVEIKRVIYEDGENEYYINNAKVRNKDIQTMLLDVTSKFNIITQGNINALVENKSSEKRILIESAAGVLKYKKRKEETLKKLDATKENISKVDLIIKELNTTLKPLEKQKKEAEKYLAVKEELESIDIALSAEDIKNYNLELKELNDKINTLEKEKENTNLIKPEKYEALKVESFKLNDEINNLNNALIIINENISKLNSEKQINLERNKYSVDKDKVNEDLLNLKEKRINLLNNIENLKNNVNSLQNELQIKTKEHNEYSDLLLKNKINITNLNNGINILNKDIMFLQNKINIEKSNLENNSLLPKSVNSILNNPRLTGIHNTIGNVIEINDAHTIAINTALSSSTHFLIVDNESSAKGAINYLKENNLGRATFFPIDIIKSRHISKDIEYTLESLKGYIGIASDLVSYKDIYKDIIENQLGNVIVVDDIDAMFTISKTIDYKYKVVSLDGEVIFPGGSIQGGTSNKEKNNKVNLNSLLKDLDIKKELLNNNSIELSNAEKEYDKYNNLNNKSNEEITTLRFNISIKEKEIQEQNNNIDKIDNDIKGLGALTSNALDQEIENIINKIGKEEQEKTSIEEKLTNLKSKQFDLNNELNTLEKEISETNSKYHQLENSIKNNQIEVGKLEVKIDNLLTSLNDEYNITYEYAVNNYTLNLETSLAREKVINLKNSIKGLTNINTGSIAEYDRLKKRYDFLDNQRNDLLSSSDELLKIISEMDDIMREKFSDTFNKVSHEFTRIFRQMFKGGNGLLKLTDEEDLLNTGITIMAVPPGKKLNSTISLSGGEKALTAICLIFAILSVKPTPFVVLDEVEAALDEENVNMFGEYLSSMKDKSQFILITHKKKMMEYADILYGITMQESGVSKLVSVKIED